MSVRIIIADDHKIMREGLRSLIERKADLEVVAEAGDGRTAVRLSRELSPDLIVMDIGMPDLNGIEATRQILAKNPDIKVVALSMHTEKRFVAEMFKVGAFAYVLKDCAFEELVSAIHAVVANKRYLSPGLTDLVTKDHAHLFPDAKLSYLSSLSPREREVLQLLTEGRKMVEIASVLNLSVKTIETHRKKIMEKLGTNNIAELTKLAIREGLTSLES